MLTFQLDLIWKAATVEEQTVAKAHAVRILETLVHYPTTGKRRYCPDDVEMLAAELLAQRVYAIEQQEARINPMERIADLSKRLKETDPLESPVLAKEINRQIEILQKIGGPRTV